MVHTRVKVPDGEMGGGDLWQAEVESRWISIHKGPAESRQGVV